MNVLLIIICLLTFASSLKIEENFDINDVENNACQYGCETENVRKASADKTSENLISRINQAECSILFELCIKFRTCEDNCVPEMPVLPYKLAREMTERVRPPLNPCLDLVTACNFESMDSYEILRTENPFLFV